MEEKAILGVRWTVMSYGANKVVTVLTTLVLARLLSPADFGVLAITMIIVNLLFWFGGLSFANTLVVRQDLDESALRTTQTLMLISGLAAAIVAAAAAPLVADAFGSPRVDGVLLALSSMFIIVAFTSFYDAMLQRELEFLRRFIATGTQTVSYAVIAVTLAILGAGVWSLVLASIGSNLLWAGALLVLAPRRVWFGFDRAQVRSLVQTGRGFLAQGVTVFVRQNADNVTVGRAFGSAALGFYSMAYRIGDLTYWAVADPVARVTFPAFARGRERGDDIRTSFLGVLRLVALVGCPLGILLSGAADPFTRAILGPRWVPMIAPLAVLGIWAALRPIDTTLFWLLNSIQRADLVAWLSVAILVPLIPGFIIAVSVGHLTAVAVVVVGDTVISVAVLAYFVRRHAGIHLLDLWRAVAPIVVGSLPAWVAARLVATALTDSSPVVGLILSVAAGVVAYAVSIRLIDRSLLSQAGGHVMRILAANRPTATAAPPA